MEKIAKSEIIKKHARKEGDTGSTEVQIAVMTQKIAELTEHMQAHKKDQHSRRGLIGIVSRRKRLLSYLSKTDFEKYTALTEQLGIRKGH